MKSFLEYLKEYEKQLKEDAVMAANSSTAAGVEVASPADIANANMKTADVIQQSGDAAIPTTDNSVLGKPYKKNNGGFFGKDDFYIPHNVLSGDIQRKIEPYA